MLEHGSRSGKPLTIQQEFIGTAGWAVNEDNPLGWNATYGEGIIALHIPLPHWGWNAFAASALYVAGEYAQPTENYDITDLMVRTRNWFFAKVVRPAFPNIPLLVKSHSEVEASGEIGHTPSGKSDVFGIASPRMDDLRARIRRNLADEWGISA